MSAIGSATGDLVLHHIELLGESALQTCGVEGSECGHLTGFQARVEQGHQTGEVGRVENNHNVLHVGAVFLDVLTQFLGDFAVAGEQVLAGHASLTGSTTRGDDILSVGKSLGSIGSGSDFHIAETALTHFLSNALGREHIVKTDVVSQTHHQSGLNHV